MGSRKPMRSRKSFGFLVGEHVTRASSNLQTAGVNIEEMRKAMFSGMSCRTVAGWAQLAGRSLASAMTNIMAADSPRALSNEYRRMDRKYVATERLYYRRCLSDKETRS